ncbi:MAG TPA: hypothetical protein VNN76_05680 [Bacteroidota bacterium]|nr:hypothetical protein [Bacteroidota bacterium]
MRYRPELLLVVCLVIRYDLDPQSLTGREILSRVEQATFSRVKDFEANIEAEVNMERLRMPNVQGILKYKQPDRIHLESKNFAMIPREGVVLNPAILLERYDVTVTGWDTVEMKLHHKLQLAAKSERTRLRQLFLWVDPDSWTITKMETVMGEGRTVTIFYEYEMVDSVPMPKSVQVRIEALRQEPQDKMVEVEPEFSPRPDRVRQAIQSGTIKIKFTNYKLNVGLTDEQFERKEKE